MEFHHAIHGKTAANSQNFAWAIASKAMSNYHRLVQPRRFHTWVLLDGWCIILILEDAKSMHNQLGVNLKLPCVEAVNSL